MADPNVVNYSDANGTEYSETATSPIAVTVREDELREAGYSIKSS